MAVKGKQRVAQKDGKQLFVGFTAVKVVAINPNRKELNELIGKEDSPEDKELIYMSTDNEGQDRLRLAFWLEDVKTGKLFPYSFNLTNKERKNKDADKVQIVNSTCSTSWVPFNKDGDTDTSEVNDAVIQDWFVNFTDKEKQVLGKKKWRKALAGEEELATLLRSWLGRLNFMDPETEVMVDTKKLFKENYKELRELISLNEEGEFGADGLDTPFVILMGVRTDEEDSTKKYQQVWGKSFLPESFMKFINNGNKFPTDYAKKVWKKFTEEVIGDYGFNGYVELLPLMEYDEAKDALGGGKTATEAVEPTSSDY